MNDPVTIAIVGPTATGKTQLGVALARHFGTDVISCDSQLVYKDFNIGVARPTPEEMQNVRHHMIGVAEPDRHFSAGEYADMARPIMHTLQSARKTVLLVGGTGFYLNALLSPRALPDIAVDNRLRQSLLCQAKQENGLQTLYRQLQQCDPSRAMHIHPHDQVRIIRALEINRSTGKPVPPHEVVYGNHVRFIGLHVSDRAQHIKIIEMRLQKMMSNGFLNEVKSILNQYGDCPALQKAHGYPELVAHLNGALSLDEAQARIAINIRQYAKRQMTWFKKLPHITWFDSLSVKPEHVLLCLAQQRG